MLPFLGTKPKQIPSNLGTFAKSIGYKTRGEFRIAGKIPDFFRNKPKGNMYWEISFH
jgi:hypothetical protein